MPPVSAAKLILHVFPSFDVGGAQMRFVDLANNFGNAYRHGVVALDGRHGAAALLSPSLDIAYPEIALPRGGSPITILRNAWRTARLLRRLRPGLLVTSNWGTIEWALGAHLAGTPHLHMEDGFGPEERLRQIPRRVLIRRLALRRCTTTLPSRTLQQIALGVWRLPPVKLVLVPNGVNLARFTGGMPPAPWPEDCGPVIGTVAALRPEKNIARLVRAFAQVRASVPCRLAIVGDGPQRVPLQALAGELGVAESVVFTGHLTKPEQALRNMDVFALSSDTEQMPISLLEAMASGLPVVSTDVGDVRAMLPPEAAPWITTLDDKAFARALTDLLNDSTQRSLLGQANRARAETAFDQDLMFAAWKRLFDEGRPGGKAPGYG
jgi:glycosyltransferase involved in cell wall biosynthesis